MNKYKSRGYVTKYKREKTLGDSSDSSTILKRKPKKPMDLEHPHPTSSNHDPQKHIKPHGPCQKPITEEQRNETEIPNGNTCFGMFPWNGMMFPFFYVWNAPQ